MPMRRFWVIGCAALAGRGDPSTASKSRPGGTGGGFSDGETRVFFATGSRARAPRASPGSGHHEEHRDEYGNVFRTD
jgi:hypothetical protein